MIKYGISELSVIPVRREPRNESEMTTQVLFGEVFEILEEQDNWSNIKLDYDNYEGWVDTKMISIISEEAFDKICSGPTYITHKLSNVIIKGVNEKIILTAGASIPNYIKETNSFLINENQYRFVEDFSDELITVVSTAIQFLNSPYLWGGKNPFGIDCSGFAQVVFKILGIKLLRDTKQQVNDGENVSFISEVKAGDLAFFGNEEGEIIHVGIILNQSEIIHASGKVRIDKIDQHGIFNSELKKYTHKLRVIKRVL